MNLPLILAGTLVTLVGVWSAGLLFRRILRLPDALHPTLIFGAGAAILSTVLFAVCAAGMLYAAGLVVLFTTLIVLARRLPQSWPQLPRSPWILAFLPFLIWYFVYALAPEVSPDGTYYHLTYPKQYLEHHGFFPIVYNMYASLPQGLEMLFLPALAISGNFSSAALIHLSFVVLLAAAIVHYGEAKLHAWIAAFLVFASPVVGFDASIAYNDVALAACIFLTFAASTEIRPEAPRQAILAGVLAGFCFAIKYTGALAIPFAVTAVAIRTRTAKWPLLTLAAAMAIAGPWLVKNWIWLDNPVSPFFNRVFENPYIRVELEDQYRANMKRFGGHSLGASTPFELTVNGGQLQGIAGPVFLLAPLAFLGSWRMALAGVFFALPWTQNIGTRFLIPALPFFAYGLAILLTRWRQWPGYLASTAHAVLSWPPIVTLYCAPWCWRIEEFPLRAAIRYEPQDAYINRRIPDTYNIVQLINIKTEPGSRVYTALPLPDAYCDRVVLLDYTSALSNRVRDGFRAHDVNATLTRLRAANVQYVLLHRDEPHAPAIESDPRSWRMEKAGESGPGRLYKLL